MLEGLIRIRDVAELLQQPRAQLERDLRRRKVPFRKHSGEVAVDWQQLTEALGEQALGKLIKAAHARQFDLRRFVWTVASFPELACQWDHRRNRGLEVADVSVGSTARAVWWKCSVANNHSWQSEPSRRFLKQNDGTYRITGCPFCSHHRSTPQHSLAKEFPAIARQWDQDRNSPLGPKDVAPSSHKEVWWRCSKNHQWKASIRSRTVTKGKCPFCAGTRFAPETSLSAIEPTLAAEWHPTRNGRRKPTDVTSRTRQKAWWQCPAASDHKWQASPAHRKQHPSCPYCANRLASGENNLASLFPAIAKQWHPTKNGRLRPRDVVAGSRKLVWWKCPKGSDHEWNCRVANRTRRDTEGCPFCSGRFVSNTNSLARLHPNIAKQWHPNRNGALGPSNIIATSTKTVWWQCRQGHEWKTPVRSRMTNKWKFCPKCANRILER